MAAVPSKFCPIKDDKPCRTDCAFYKFQTASPAGYSPCAIVKISQDLAMIKNVLMTK